MQTSAPAYRSWHAKVIQANVLHSAAAERLSLHNPLLAGEGDADPREAGGPPGY
jgi:hypothetical protein